MKKSTKKILSGAASMTLLAANAAQVAVADTQALVTETASYDEIANVKGSFSFNQDVIAPADAVFSLFGTAATGVCAKPAFAMDTPAAEETYYVNVSGRLEKSYTTSLSELKAKGGVTRTMVCTCATGGAVSQAQIKGVLVKDMLQLAGVMDDANAITFKSADGYVSTLPLQYVLDKEAVLAWQVGDEANPAGLQVWMPATVAKYFTRQVAEIEVLHSNEAISVEGPAAEQRAKVSILNRMGEVCSLGDELVFSGYADDCGTAISAVEFSLDGGKTWTRCATEGTSADRWVAWEFGYVAETAGTFKLDVRAVAADGTVSPLSASVVFTVA